MKGEVARTLARLGVVAGVPGPAWALICVMTPALAVVAGNVIVVCKIDALGSGRAGSGPAVALIAVAGWALAMLVESKSCVLVVIPAVVSRWEFGIVC